MSWSSGAYGIFAHAIHPRVGDTWADGLNVYPRADIHHGPEHNKLQSETGYIDEKTADADENLHKGDLNILGAYVHMAADAVVSAGVMGTATDVAIESPGITLLKGDLIGIVRARRPSQATMNAGKRAAVAAPSKG
jgi:hypothetical protein